MPTEYDAAAALERIENELIDSMMRNLQRHLKEEETMGFDWSQWQTEQLRYLEEYRKKNAKKYGPQFSSINRRIKHAITHARASGQKEEELRILEMMAKHPELKKTLRKTGTASIQGGSFFKINEGKMDALLKATTNDMTRAEHAVLRRCNDQYRKIIFDAQMYANTGAGTIQKALDMATHDFLMRGIDCIEYKNGARHTISDYADMAIRTAERRAALMGAGETRKAWGEELVIVNRRGTMRGGNFGHACPLCIPWLGKVLIDDVYSGGKPDGRHQLVSTAMQQGFLHPRCKDSFTTYFPGVTSEPEPVTKQELQKGAEQDKQETERQYAERKAEQYGRVAKYQCDSENQQKYEARAENWKTISVGYDSSPVTAGLNAPAITNSDEVVEEFIKAIDLPKDNSVIERLMKSVRHMPKEDLDMIRKHGLIVRKTKGASCFVRSRRSRGTDGKLKHVIRINPDRDEPFVFAHECAHLAEKINNLYQDAEFSDVLNNLENSITDIVVGLVDNEYYATGVSDLFIEPYQGRTYIRHLGRFGPERPVTINDFVEYISVGYETYVGDPKLLESKDPKLYNYFKRRGLR